METISTEHMRKHFSDDQQFVKIVIADEFQWFLIHQNVEWLFCPELVELVESDEYKDADLDEKSKMVADVLNISESLLTATELKTGWVRVDCPFFLLNGCHGDEIVVYSSELKSITA